MPTPAQLMTSVPRPQVTVQALIQTMTGATTTVPDMDFVNATGRTPTNGQRGVFIRITGVMVLVGLI